MAGLPQKYDHKETEAARQRQWEESGVYRWDETAAREETFVIDTPPPTVSGLLHMGHVFSYVQADFVARYQRMRGKSVFYPMGFDDNGLPTERLTEKAKKVRAHSLPREEFIRLCEEVSEEARQAFRDLFKSTALSVDWRQEYHTISARSRALSQMSFIDLYKKNQAYREMKPMFWDPVDRTAIAQAEVEDKELKSHFCDVAFTVEGTGERVVIGTTRPELLPACVAVFFHPEDERYVRLAGKRAVTPLFGASVPFLADDAVKPEKGTGLVMCCTFGDETDVMWQKKHGLPLRVVLAKDGRLEGVSPELEGKKVEEARAHVIAMLEAEGLLLKKEPIVHAVKCAERSGAPLEILPSEQWFIKVLEHKEALKKRAAECEWRPAFMRVRIEQWIDGLSWDWCISRQRYYGVPFPVWYSRRPGEEGKVLLPDLAQLPVNPLVDLPAGYSRDEIVPDADVMDTWATSSISPQLNSGGVAAGYALDPERHKKLFPADLRPQAHEIIRTWAFYTIVKAHLHEDAIPWKNVMVSGWCLAADKTKMSKSKGNVVTPEALVKEMGADVVRYWASTSKLGADTAYSEDVLRIGKKLTTKLWNASKFAALQLKADIAPTTPKEDAARGAVSAVLDRWALAELGQAVEKATDAFERYEYSEARAHAERFFWDVFCDNYLEMAKVRSYGEAEGVTEAGRKSAAYTIHHCLETLLRLLAPFLPHLTEELYEGLFPERHARLGGSVHARRTWPKIEEQAPDEASLNAGALACAVMDAVRKLKAERGVSIKWPLEALTVSAPGAETVLGDAASDVAFAANAARLSFGKAQEGAATTDAGAAGSVSAVFAAEAGEGQKRAGGE